MGSSRQVKKRTVSVSVLPRGVHGTDKSCGERRLESQHRSKGKPPTAVNANALWGKAAIQIRDPIRSELRTVDAQPCRD